MRALALHRRIAWAICGDLSKSVPVTAYRSFYSSYLWVAVYVYGSFSRWYNDRSLYCISEQNRERSLVYCAFFYGSLANLYVLSCTNAHIIVHTRSVTG